MDRDQLLTWKIDHLQKVSEIEASQTEHRMEFYLKLVWGGIALLGLFMNLNIGPTDKQWVIEKLEPAVSGALVLVGFHTLSRLIWSDIYRLSTQKRLTKAFEALSAGHSHFKDDLKWIRAVDKTESKSWHSRVYMKTRGGFFSFVSVANAMVMAHLLVPRADALSESIRYAHPWIYAAIFLACFSFPYWVRWAAVTTFRIENRIPD
jgi:hypothetical protein